MITLDDWWKLHRRKMKGWLYPRCYSKGEYEFWVAVYDDLYAEMNPMDQITALTRRAFVPKVVVQLYKYTPILSAMLK